MNKFAITFLCFLGVACSTPTEASQQLSYSKDHRTGLCFASRFINFNNAVMTYVPCTQEVEKLIPINCEHEDCFDVSCSSSDGCHHK